MMTIILKVSFGFLKHSVNELPFKITESMFALIRHQHSVYSSLEERDAKTFKRDMVTTAKTKFVISLPNGNGMKEWS